MSWLEGTRARLRLLFARRNTESRMNEEFRFHLEMEAERLVREGVDPVEARRRAFVIFGGVENHKETLRDGRGLAWISGMSLDLKLGIRMMLRYPGLTVVGILGMAVAVAIGTVSFGIIYTIYDPSVPLDEGARIVQIRNIDQRRGDQGRRTHLHDLPIWREALTAVEDLGAYRTIDRNLITHERRPEPVRIAEMTASGFRIARVNPLEGRYFNDEDERNGAPPVVVIGYSVWQGRFAGQADIVGRTLQLGNAAHTVIGVMPEGFAFPVNNRVWTPLRLDPTDFQRGDAPAIEVFGRLARGASMADAGTQLSTIAKRLATTYPETHERIRSRIVPYARAFTDAPEAVWMMHLIQLAVTMLLVVIGTNVAILVYARTASRTGEIAMRSALGASRGRIVAQLFAEALVLSLAAAAVGLAIGWVSLEQAEAFLQRAGGEQLPFWLRFDLSPGMVIYVLVLAALGAAIVGALPALKATRRQLHATLQQGSGGTAMKLGKTWTVLIVSQVAMAVAVLPLAVAGSLVVVRQALATPAVPTGEWMTASLHLDREGYTDSAAEEGDATSNRAFEARYASLQSDLLRLVRAEPRVVDVVLISSVPGEEPTARIEVEGAPAAADSASQAGFSGHDVQRTRVDPEFFPAFGVPLLTGRQLRIEDASAGERGGEAVVVNRAFVQEVLGGEDPLGRRVRLAVRNPDPDAEPARPESWAEIVGVVADFPNPVNPRFPEPRMYQALPPGVGPVLAAVRTRGGDPAEFGGRLRELSLAVDPMLRIQRVAALDDSLQERLLELRVLIGAVVVLALSVLLLSAAGIYALISFTVTRRRREIGIRAALGAGSRQVISGVLARSMRQIGVGIVVGSGVAGLLDHIINGGYTGGRGIYLLAAIAALMAGVGCIAAIGPARRALRIQPTEALKSE